MKTYRMRVLGIDPGSNHTGYSVVEDISGNIKALEWGVISPPRHHSFPEKIKHIYDCLTELLLKFKPNIMAIEEIFFAKNPQSALKLGQARGAIIVAGANASIPITEYTALQVKQSLVGYGRADKEQVRAMVMRCLNIKNQKIPLDASDALAVSICHLNSHAFNKRLTEAGF